MTKSKKMKKSTFAIVIMAILMVAMLAFGGTYAYFTASVTAKNAGFTTGKVMITGESTITATKEKIVPGDKVFEEDTAITYTNGSNVNTFVYATLTFTYTGDIYDGDDTKTVLEDQTVTLTDPQILEAFGSASALTSMLNANWVPGTGVYMLKGTDGSLIVSGDDYKSGVAFIEVTDTKNLTFSVDRHFKDGQFIPANADADELVWEDATVTITVEVKQIQAENIGATATTVDDVDAVYAKIQAALA